MVPLNACSVIMMMRQFFLFRSFFFSSSFLMMLYNVCWCVVRVCEWLREYESELGDSYISFLFLLDFFVTCFILIKLTIKLLLLSTWFVLLSLLWLDIKLVLVMYCAPVFVSLSISSICSNLLFWIFLTLLFFFSGFTSSSFSFCVFFLSSYVFVTCTLSPLSSDLSP